MTRPNQTSDFQNTSIWRTSRIEYTIPIANGYITNRSMAAAFAKLARA